MKKISFFILAALVALSCNPTKEIVEGDSNIENSQPDTDNSDDTDDDDSSQTPPIDSSDDDYVENSSFPTTVSILFSSSGALVEGAVDGLTIERESGHVVVNSSVEGVEYRLSGSSSEGSLKIYSDKKFLLTLSSLSLTNPTGAAINIQSSKRAFVVLADGTVNTLSDGTSYSTTADEDMKATLFSEGQIVVSGEGTLNISSRAKHAICSDEYMRMRSGTVNITAAAKDGVHCNDKVVVEGGSLSIASTGDGIECEEGFVGLAGGTVVVDAGDDGIVASYEGDDQTITPYVALCGATVEVNTTAQKGMAVKSSGNIYVNNGSLNATVKGNGSKCMKASGNVIIEGGDLDLQALGSAFYDTDDSDISSPACINSDGAVSFAAARATLKSTGSAGKGISCDGDFTMQSGSLTVATTGKQYTYNRLDSSAKGIKSSGNVTVNGGQLNITTSGGEGSEGLESKNILTINDGTVEIFAYDDCINASKQIVVNGGKTYAYSSNNDGIDSNGTLTITGGFTIASGTNSPEEGFDCDQNTFKITGGTVIGIGGATSTPTQSVTTQYTLVYGASATQNKIVAVQDNNGKTLMAFVVPRTYSQMTLLFSSPDMVANTTYKILTGGTVSGGEAWNGCYNSGTYSGGTQATTFTTSSVVTSVGNTSGGGGGNPGGGGWRP